MPKDGPHINGDSDHRSYHMGETLELNCTSGRSYPASTLQWYLNDVQVTDPGMLVPYPRFQNPHGLITSYLGLNVVVGPHHYRDGILRIRCVASLSPVLWREGKESILQWEQPTLDNREAMLLGELIFTISQNVREFYTNLIIVQKICFVWQINPIEKNARLKKCYFFLFFTFLLFGREKTEKGRVSILIPSLPEAWKFGRKKKRTVIWKNLINSTVNNNLK